MTAAHCLLKGYVFCNIAQPLSLDLNALVRQTQQLQAGWPEQ